MTEAIKYNLAWSYSAAAFFRQNNLFYYQQQVEEWLGTARAMASLADRLHSAYMEAAVDAEAIRIRLTQRSFTVRDMIRDMVVLGAAAKAGYRTTIPCTMVPGGCTGQKVVGDRTYYTGLTVPLNDQAAVESWSSWFQDQMKSEAKDAIKDMSLIWIVLDGIRRRMAKLQHNAESLSDEMYDRLYVPFSPIIKDYLHELVFKGLWGADSRHQPMFNAIVETFCTLLPWSPHAISAKEDVVEIRDEFKYVSDNRTRQGLLEIVDVAMQFGGGIAA